MSRPSISVMKLGKELASLRPSASHSRCPIVGELPHGGELHALRSSLTVSRSGHGSPRAAVQVGKLFVGRMKLERPDRGLVRALDPREGMALASGLVTVWVCVGDGGRWFRWT